MTTTITKTSFETKKGSCVKTISFNQAEIDRVEAYTEQKMSAVVKECRLFKGGHDYYEGRIIFQINDNVWLCGQQVNDYWIAIQ